MKRHLLPIQRVFYSRLSLYFFAAIVLFLAISGLATHVVILSGILLNSVGSDIKLGHARLEMARLIVLCVLFGVLLFTRRPLNKKDTNFNTTCSRYGRIFLASGLFLIAVFFLINLDPTFFPELQQHNRLRIFFWPLVNIFYIITSVGFVYYSLQD